MGFGDTKTYVTGFVEGAQVQPNLLKSSPAGTLSSAWLFWRPLCAEQWAPGLFAGDGRWFRLSCTSTPPQISSGSLAGNGRDAMGNGTRRSRFGEIQLQQQERRWGETTTAFRKLKILNRNFKKKKKSTVYDLDGCAQLPVHCLLKYFLLLQHKPLS